MLMYLSLIFKIRLIFVHLLIVHVPCVFPCFLGSKTSSFYVCNYAACNILLSRSTSLMFVFSPMLDKGCRLHNIRRCPRVTEVSSDLGMFSVLCVLVLSLLHIIIRLILNGFSFQGNHPDDKQPVILKLAKVGFSIRHRRTIASVPKV